MICVARNYAAHARELGNDPPQSPALFIKPDSALIPKHQPFFIPPFSNDVHYEVEVVLRVCRVGKYIQPQFAPRYYDAVALGVDFTARDLQTELKAKALPWEKAKAFDSSALVSPFHDKEAYDLTDLNFSLHKNGQVVQQGNTGQMLWGVNELIAYITTFFTLKIGDLIFTGTPQGVGSVAPEDVLEGYLQGARRFQIKIK